MKNRNIHFPLLLLSVVFGFIACDSAGNTSVDYYTPPPVVVPGAYLSEKLSWLDLYATSGTSYIVEIDADESISPRTISYSYQDGGYTVVKPNITITLKGIGTTRIISLSANGSMFKLDGYKITFVLGENLELRGRNNNTAPLITVSGWDKCSLIMNPGTKISGNNNISTSSSYSYGGGVRVSSRGSFTMNGGEISGNTTSTYGGGVYIDYDTNGRGSFIMNGGKISGNTSALYGGWVYVNCGGGFLKTGGTIFGYTDGISDSNIVKNNSGVLQQNKGHAVHITHNLAIYTMGRDTTSGPGNNLSFNGSTNPPVYSGVWDY